MFVLTCLDLASFEDCCPQCIDNPDGRTMVYPRGLYVPSAPDQSMGIKAMVCCYHIHFAKTLDRGWWLNEMLRRSNRYTKDDIRRLLAVCNVQEVFYKTWGSIHEGSRQRELSNLRLTRPKVISSCPSCGSSWNQIVCNNCGQIGV